jgi:hemerythrin-like domain-containing protein
MDIDEFKRIERENDAQAELDLKAWDWIDLNRNSLEMEFIETFPAEDQPLDDVIHEFLNNCAEEFEEFCKDKWYENGRL